MNTITFDTLKFAETLIASGIPEAQAKAISHAFSEAQKDLSPATKDDLLQLESRYNDKLLLLEQRMTIKLGSLMVLAIAVVATLVKIL